MSSFDILPVSNRDVVCRDHAWSSVDSSERTSSDKTSFFLIDPQKAKTEGRQIVSNNPGMFWLSRGDRVETFSETEPPRLVERVKTGEGELSIPYAKYVFANGLTLIFHEDHSNPMTYVDLTYKVGSKNETPGYTGFAHLYEHMMFEGSRHLGRREISELVDEMGGSSNGETSRDYTHYHEKIPARELELILWAESDRMATVLEAVDQARFDTQRTVVKSEKLQNYDNKRYGLFNQTLFQSLYDPDHPYFSLPIGNPEDLDRATLEDVQSFYHRYYGPNNAVLTISGDFDEQEVLAWVQKYFGSIPPGRPVKQPKPQAAKLTESRYVTYTDPYITEPEVLFVYPTIERYHPDEPALDMLVRILSSGQDSLFYKRLQETRIAQGCSVKNPTDMLAGNMRFSFYPTPDYSLADIERLFDETLAEFEKTGFSDELLKRHQVNRKTGVIDDLGTIEEKTNTLSGFEVFLGNPGYLPQDIARYDDVTAADVWRVYEKYIKGRPRLVLSAVPNDHPEMAVREDNFTAPQVSEARGEMFSKKIRPRITIDSFDRSIRPQAAEPKPIALPEPWQVTLESGVPVMGAVNDELPVVKVQFRFQAGEIFLTPDKIGTTGLLRSLMGYSTQHISSEEMSQRLQSLGSKISFSSDRYYVTLDVWSLKENLDETLKIAEDMIFYPAFDQAAFERFKANKIEYYKNTFENPVDITSRIFNHLIYEDTHYSDLPYSKILSAIEGVTYNDVVKFYQDVFCRQGAEIFVVGDITPAEATESLSFMKAWQGKSVERHLSEPGQLDKTRVYLVDIPGSAQSRIRIGYRTTEDWDPVGRSTVMSIMNDPLGGKSGCLFKSLRTEHKYTYGASASFVYGDEGGRFLAESDVDTPVTLPALQEMLHLIKAYRDNGPTQEELDASIKSDVQGKYLSYEGLESVMGYVQDLYTDHLPPDFVQKHIQYVSALTLADIKEEAQRSLDIDHMAILVVGDRACIENDLKTLGYEVVILDYDGEGVPSR